MKKKTANEELHSLYCSPNINQVVKSRSMRWEGHEAHMGEDCIQCWVRKPEAKKEAT
jgi:hypothetical protein